jgi:hypothetical protein
MNFTLQDLTKRMRPVAGSNVEEPDSSISILNEGRSYPSFLVQSQLPADKVSQTGFGSYPKAAISRGQHGINRG